MSRPPLSIRKCAVQSCTAEQILDYPFCRPCWQVLDHAEAETVRDALWKAAQTGRQKDKAVLSTLIRHKASIIQQRSL